MTLGNSETSAAKPLFHKGQIVVFDREGKKSIPAIVLDVVNEDGAFFYRIDRKNCMSETMLRAPNAKELGTDRVNSLSIEIFQHDWVPGFAAFLYNEERFADTAKAHVILNLGSLLAAVQEGDLGAKQLPYMIAESLMHEVIHVLEAWAGVEFSEDRVEELLTKYREKYSRNTVWQYTGAEPSKLEEVTDAKL